jgi:hypothetical protein
MKNNIYIYCIKLQKSIDVEEIMNKLAFVPKNEVIEEYGTREIEYVLKYHMATEYDFSCYTFTNISYYSEFSILMTNVDKDDLL